MIDGLLVSEVEALFAPLLRYSRLVLGVSGGADSVCLMELIAEWRAALPVGGSPDICVVTIDHRLRETSAAEASCVAKRAEALGFSHKTLSWTDPKPESGLQARARTLRYRLLLTEAQAPDGGRAAVVVAHTQDDQGETVLMRLKRGSGLDGLAGMAPVRELGENVDLVRPFLSVPRLRIEATLAARGVSFIADPSNENPAFERVRVRKAQGDVSALQLSNKMLALSAARLARARRALDAVTHAFLEREVALHNGAFAALERAAFLAEPQEIQVRAVEALIKGYGDGAAEPALLSQVEDVVAGLTHEAQMRVSLGGAIVSAGERTIRVYREVGRLAHTGVMLEPGASLVWDGRFLVADERIQGREPLAVAPLGAVAAASGGGGEAPQSVDATLAAAGLDLPLALKDWPKRALATLPALWAGSRLIAVPHFDEASATDKGFRVTFLGLEGLGSRSRAHLERGGLQS